MCMLLKRAENQSTCSLISLFYSKRFKRILPLYLLVILISIISLYYFFPDTAIEPNQESAIQALLFVSNRPKSDQENYFEMLSTAVNIFTHTWSLSVEIQFYFLVPFIFLFSTKFSEKYRYIYYGILSVFSFIFFYSLEDAVAFNSVFARIWQFLIGMVVYLLGTETLKSGIDYRKLQIEEAEHLEKLLEEGGTEKKSSNEVFSFSSFLSSYTVLLLLVPITLFPYDLPAVSVRPLVTLGTGFLMLISEDNLFLSNRFLTYIGDISYSLYLIHWPIYAYWKLTQNGDKSMLILALASSIVLAVITFETFEKWCLKLTSTSIGFLVILLFTPSVMLIKKDELLENMYSIGRNTTSLDEVTAKMTNEDAVEMNHRWSVNDHKNLFVPTCDYEREGSPYGWCRHKKLPENGKHKMMIFGNSWTANHANLFLQECGYKAKSILQGAAWGCEPLFFTKSKVCLVTDFLDRIEKEKPDYAFYIARSIGTGKPFLQNVTTFDEDRVYQKMKSQMLKMIENIKHKLYILNAIPTVESKEIRNIAGWVKDKKDYNDTQIPLLKDTGFEMSRKRYAKLVEDCNGKCLLIDYKPVFYNDSTKLYEYYDERGFSYWTSSMHFSPHGIEHVRPVWKNVCDKL
uniref:Acyl_transf_3 domain-containing protein n=1 Tax=Caenorhabditis tropicalis TaxID=1561998 RepID=A0A1I7U2X5_9PELO